MKTSAKIGGIVAAVMLAVSGASFAAEQVNPYVHSSSGDIVKNSTGLCWRTGFWTPALAEALGVNGAGCACDADILDAAACKAVEEPAPAKAAEKARRTADKDTPTSGDTRTSSDGNQPKKKNKLTYKEQKELEQIEKDLQSLNEEKAALEKSLSDGSLPYDKLQKASERIGEILALTEEKENRWLELSC